MQKVNRVIWFPTGHRAKSSSRIQVYNIHSKLIELGYDSIIGYEPKRTIWHLPILEKDIEKMNLQKDDLIIIQKFKKLSTVRVLKLLRKTKAQIGYIDCDVPIAPNAISDLVDFVIVPSIYLKEEYEKCGVKCISIPDCPEKYVDSIKTKTDTDSLKCVWFGNYSTSKWKEVHYFNDILTKHYISNWKFETISNNHRATKRWNKNSFNELTNYDLVVIPVPEMTLDYKVKSANRLLQSMALGLPVIASEIPSYNEVIPEENVSDIICKSEEDWVEKLKYFSIKENRTKAIEQNQKLARTYSLDNIINNWIDTFQLTKENQKEPFNSKIINKIKWRARLLGYEIRLIL